MNNITEKSKNIKENKESTILKKYLIYENKIDYLFNQDLYIFH